MCVIFIIQTRVFGVHTHFQATSFFAFSRCGLTLKEKTVIVTITSHNEDLLNESNEHLTRALKRKMSCQDIVPLELARGSFYGEFQTQVI